MERVKMCKTKATVTLFVSLLNMHIRVSDVTLSVPCHRTRARVITIILEILWRVTISTTTKESKGVNQGFLCENHESVTEFAP